jgi:hypothetical protein
MNGLQMTCNENPSPPWRRPYHHLANALRRCIDEQIGFRVGGTLAVLRKTFAC